MPQLACKIKSSSEMSQERQKQQSLIFFIDLPLHSFFGETRQKSASAARRAFAAFWGGWKRRSVMTRSQFLHGISWKDYDFAILMPELACKIKPSSEMSKKRDKSRRFDLLHRPTPPFLFRGDPAQERIGGKMRSCCVLAGNGKRL